MAMPKKGSRVLTIDGQRYRWVVSVHDNAVNLVVEHADDVGQRLLAYFECRDLYVRADDGSWKFVSQQQSIRPSHVRRIISAAIKRGWEPQQKGTGAFILRDAAEIAQTIDVEPIDSRRIDPEAKEAYVKEVARDFIATYMALSLCMDGVMHERIENLQPNESIPFGNDSMKAIGLTFSAFRESLNDDGWLVIRLQCNEFPDVKLHYSWICFA